MRNLFRTGAAAALLGMLIGVVFTWFEWIVNHVPDYLWNDLLHTDVHRWRVVPLAILMSLVFSLVCYWLRESRLKDPETELLGEGRVTIPTDTLGGLAKIFIIGALSLVAGASLGPEASLVALSIGLTGWLMGRSHDDARVQWFAISSIGALLAVFLGSLVPILIPVLLILKQQKVHGLKMLYVPVICGLATYGTVWVMQGSVTAFGEIPIPGSLTVGDYESALLVGAAMSVAAAFLRRWIERFYRFTSRVITRAKPWVPAAIFGLVPGLLYLIGGETVQFSGSEGSSQLASQQAMYGTFAFLGLAIVKALVTGWSLTIGYRGGLVFPSVYIGVALALFFNSAFPALDVAGVALGSIAGIITAMTSPLLAGIMVVSLLPLHQVMGAVAGIVGATIGQIALRWIQQRKLHHSSPVR